MRRISDIAADYFRKAEIEVSVSCFNVLDGKRFVVVIGSEPIKKFRHSYIIEQSLVRHIAKTTGQQVEKVYWRFPLMPAYEETEKPPEESRPAMDPYLAEGPPKVWAQSGYRVEETSWESYEKAYKSAHPKEVGPKRP